MRLVGVVFNIIELVAFTNGKITHVTLTDDFEIQGQTVFNFYHSSLDL